MKLPLAACLSFFLVCALAAQDLTPPDAPSLLAELAAIEAKSENTVSTRRKAALERINQAAGSREAALTLYLDAQMATQFQGANRENTQFRDWKKSEETMLKSADFAESVRLHLFYLGLTLRKAQAEKEEVLAPLVADYTRVLDKAEDALAEKGSLLKVSVTDSLFTRWLNLGPDLTNLGEWETNPGDADRIATRFLLPLWRKAKNPALLTWWDAKIASATAQAATSKLDFQESTFNKITRPSLLWQRAKELLALEQPNRAKSEMFGLIKNHPTHPNISEWIKTLRGLLAPATQAPAASPAASPAG